MEKQDFFLWGFMACTVTMLAIFHLTEPILPGLDPVPSASAGGTPLSSASSSVMPAPSAGRLPLYEPPRPFLTKEIEAFAYRDQDRITGQKCDGPLCVTCFVSDDFRRLLGETWTHCAPGAECVWIDTQPRMEQYHVPFGACERHEVPPIEEDD